MIRLQHVKFYYLLAAALTIGGSALAGTVVDASGPPQGVFFQRYYALMLGPTKCGYSVGRFERQGQKILYHNLTKIKIARIGIPIEVGQELNTVETPDGKPLGFSTITKMAGQDIRVTGKIVDGMIHAVTSQAGRQSKTSYPMPAGALMPWAEHVLADKYGLSPGTEYKVTSYSPLISTNMALESHVKVIGPETIDLLGKKVRATKIVTTVMLGNAISTDLWVDDNNEILLSDTRFGLFKLRMIACPKAVAMGDYQSVEIFNRLMIPFDRGVEVPVAKLVRYKLTCTDNISTMPTLPTTGMQRTISRRANSTIIEVRRGGFAASRSKPKLNEYLKSSTYLDLSDPLLRRMATLTAGKIVDKFKLADRLRQFVSDKITIKSFNVGFATASETAVSGEGDCSEHAVLLAALARVLKIPSRAVMGLVYSQAHKGFVYHMWTELWISGQWVDLDAALDQDRCDASHIALAASALNNEMFIDQMFNLTSLIGRVRIDIVKVTR